MKKFLLLISLLLGLIVLSACQSSEEPTNATSNTAQPTTTASDPSISDMCTVQSESADELSQPGDHITGALENYSITIVSYNDFTCQGCAAIASALAQAVELYPDDIRLIYRYFTSPAKNPLVAARAAEAAGNQGKFIEMYEYFYTSSQPWVDLGEEGFNEFIWTQVTALELNPDQFFEEISSEEISNQILERYNDAYLYLELLQGNPRGLQIAAAAEAAGRQNQFWAMYQQLLSSQDTWQELDTTSMDQYLKELAGTLGLEAETYQQDFELLLISNIEESPYSRALNYFSLFYRTPIAVAAAKTAEAAGNQGKFWEMHDLLFINQELLTTLNESSFLDLISEQFEAMEIDADLFMDDYYSQETEAVIIEDYLQARDASTTAPLVLVNGSPTPPYLTTVGDFLLWLDNFMVPYGQHIRDNQFFECPPMTIDTDAQYTATLHTEKGDILLALYPEAAPYAVNNFIFLAENDYYDNTPFYAVIEGFIVQAGDPSGTGWGTPGFLYDLEISELNFDRPYMVAMANSGPGSNSSQFFITFSPLSYLNGQHTIFGEVIEGVDVLKMLTIRDPEKDPFAPMEDHILDITIDKK
ncbi:MAG TPA: peptidylprolyl isomerase [Anaerolineales bacterium]|jgi:cyclophilin family peptidyl-prolyl cis-trans isomerase/protein-disulfide isomerase|nr:peptidylprolyl isomerase [Anaerolineales bacterium]